MNKDDLIYSAMMEDENKKGAKNPEHIWMEEEQEILNKKIMGVIKDKND